MVLLAVVSGQDPQAVQSPLDVSNFRQTGTQNQRETWDKFMDDVNIVHGYT
jgi:hypothetical protein